MKSKRLTDINIITQQMTKLKNTATSSEIFNDLFDAYMIGAHLAKTNFGVLKLQLKFNFL